MAAARASRAHVDAVFLAPDKSRIAPETCLQVARSRDFADIEQLKSNARWHFDAVAGGLPAISQPASEEKLSVNFRTIDGPPCAAAINGDLFADLLVCEFPGPSSSRSQALLLHEIVRETDGPLLLVPPAAHVTGRFFDRIVVGLSTCAHGARTIREVLPLLVHAKAVDIVGLRNDDDPGAFVERLRSYDIAANAVPLDQLGSDTVALLRRAVRERGANLLVVGGDSPKGWRRQGLNSVTQAIAGACALPVLVCH